MRRVISLLSILIVGDIATFPYAQQGGKDIRIEHWDVAINHGRTVANHIVKCDAGCSAKIFGGPRAVFRRPF